MGRDKALLQVEGKPLLDRAVEFCRLFCEEVFISSDLEEHEKEGIRRISDEQKNCGPMGGIYSCLKRSSTDWNFVLSVDAPFVEIDFVRFLLNNSDEFEAVVPLHSGKKEPLIALYHRNTLAVFRSMLEEGNYKMHFLLEKVSTHFVEAEEWLEKYPKLFENLNYPDDLHR